ncbi:Chemotaxis protein CheA [Fundidesulfovibrio magnetotacticus]|uniref:Chemotaxis protein CheA n=1 Tax=Fundidesulfovibrio magnetotacticus TaxID=2730080 RepID=A0A6V8LRT6_9BACT|nr:STAS domain-containing protein [Fundidesulfovibrio magnetotacticus]GFK95183.1 Chemotaxis protein CheA [Fundidesulfovibrio magnetotacticus]
MDSDDDILALFIEDAQEHLVGIEASLMDLEQDAQCDPELVNTIFRAAHSIKGGAGFLGLENVRELAHKLENILHMVRAGELAPSSALVSPLLKGFDLLRALIHQGLAGNGQDISGFIAELTELVAEGLPPSRQGHIEQRLSIPLPGGQDAFVLDRLTLEQALEGGRYIYLVEYDLIHDVHARGKTPLDIFAVMESSGLILDCRTDLAAVGDLDGPVGNVLPFYLLYATIVEPDVVGYLFALDVSRIRVVDPALLAPAREDAAPPPQALRLELPARYGAPELEDLRQRLLDSLDDAPALELDAGRVEKPDAALLQLLCAARRSASARGKSLRLTGLSPEAAAHCARLGFAPGTRAAAALPECHLLGQGGNLPGLGGLSA